MGTCLRMREGPQQQASQILRGGHAAVARPAAGATEQPPTVEERFQPVQPLGLRALRWDDPEALRRQHACPVTRKKSAGRTGVCVLTLAKNTKRGGVPGPHGHAGSQSASATSSGTRQKRNGRLRQCRVGLATVPDSALILANAGKRCVRIPSRSVVWLSGSLGGGDDRHHRLVSRLAGWHGGRQAPAGGAEAASATKNPCSRGATTWCGGAEAAWTTACRACPVTPRSSAAFDARWAKRA